MASGYTIISSIERLAPEITLAADTVFQDQAIGKALVRYMDISAQPGYIVEFQDWTAVAADTAFTNEYDSPTSHKMAYNSATATLARRSVFVLVSDLAVKSVTGTIVDEIGFEMGKAMAKAVDTAIFNVVTGTTNYTTGTGGTDQSFGLGYVKDGILLLEKNEVDKPLNLVCHPQAYDDIRDELTPTDSTHGIAVTQASAMLGEAFVSRMLGVNWFVTNRISTGTVTATTNVLNNLLFAPIGIGHAHSWLAVNGIEAERDAEAASTKLLLNWADSSIVARDTAVCKLYSKNS